MGQGGGSDKWDIYGRGGRQNADVLYGQPQASPASVFVGDQSTTHTPLRRRRLIGLDSLHVKEFRRYAPVGQLGLRERWLGVHGSYDSYQRVCAVPAGLTIPSP